MNDLPVPKYKIGQTVWFAEAQSTKGQYPCPDCFGSGVWAVKSPAGLETTAPCPRCLRMGAFSNNQGIPSLLFQKWVASTVKLTIGSITAKTHPYDGDDGIEYMCVETGISSGRTYLEKRLHATEVKAFEAAKCKAAEAQQRTDEQPESLKTFHYSSFTCDLAAYGLSWETLYNSWMAAHDYREIVDRIAENGNKVTEDDVEDLLACRKEKPWRKKHPLADCIEAVAAGDIDAAKKAYLALPKHEKASTP